MFSVDVKGACVCTLTNDYTGTACETACQGNSPSDPVSPCWVATPGSKDSSYVEESAYYKNGSYDPGSNFLLDTTAFPGNMQTEMENREKMAKIQPYIRGNAKCTENDDSYPWHFNGVRFAYTERDVEGFLTAVHQHHGSHNSY